MGILRVMAYNVQGFGAGPKSVAAAIAEEEPDVVCVNEAAGKGPLRRFARAMGSDDVSGLTRFGSIPNAVVVRPPWRVLESRTIKFSRTGKRLPRGAVLAHIGRSGMRAWVVSVHLGLSDSEREQHARELADALAGLRGSVIVAGDLNEGPDGAAASWLAERYWDAFAQRGEGEGLTFSSREPRARIDYVFVSEGLRVEGAWVVDSPEARAASDHLPMVADVELIPEPE